MAPERIPPLDDDLVVPPVPKLALADDDAEAVAPTVEPVSDGVATTRAGAQRVMAEARRRTESTKRHLEGVSTFTKQLRESLRRNDARDTSESSDTDSSTDSNDSSDK